MRDTSVKKFIRKSAADLRPQSLAALRRSARRPVNTAERSEVHLTGPGESHRIRKRSITLRLDEDIVQFFRAEGPGYQGRINRALRAAVHPSTTAKTLHDQLKAAAILLQQLAERTE